MIVGGTMTTGSSKKAQKTYFRIIQNVQLTSAVPKMTRIDNPVIGFLEEDADVFTTHMMMHLSLASG